MREGKEDEGTKRELGGNTLRIVKVETKLFRIFFYERIREGQ